MTSAAEQSRNTTGRVKEQENRIADLWSRNRGVVVAGSGAAATGGGDTGAYLPIAGGRLLGLLGFKPDVAIMDENGVVNITGNANSTSYLRILPGSNPELKAMSGMTPIGHILVIQGSPSYRDPRTGDTVDLSFTMKNLEDPKDAAGNPVKDEDGNEIKGNIETKGRMDVEISDRDVVWFIRGINGTWVQITHSDEQLRALAGTIPIKYPLRYHGTISDPTALRLEAVEDGFQGHSFVLGNNNSRISINYDQSEEDTEIDGTAIHTVRTFFVSVIQDSIGNRVFEGIDPAMDVSLEQFNNSLNKARLQGTLFRFTRVFNTWHVEKVDIEGASEDEESAGANVLPLTNHGVVTSGTLNLEVPEDDKWGHTVILGGDIGFSIQYVSAGGDNAVIFYLVVHQDGTGGRTFKTIDPTVNLTVRQFNDLMDRSPGATTIFRLTESASRWGVERVSVAGGEGGKNSIPIDNLIRTEFDTGKTIIAGTADVENRWGRVPVSGLADLRNEDDTPIEGIEPGALLVKALEGDGWLPRPFNSDLIPKRSLLHNTISTTIPPDEGGGKALEGQVLIARADDTVTWGNLLEVRGVLPVSKLNTATAAAKQFLTVVPPPSGSGLEAAWRAINLDTLTDVTVSDSVASGHLITRNLANSGWVSRPFGTDLIPNRSLLHTTISTTIPPGSGGGSALRGQVMVAAAGGGVVWGSLVDVRGVLPVSRLNVATGAPDQYLTVVRSPGGNFEAAWRAVNVDTLTDVEASNPSSGHLLVRNLANNGWSSRPFGEDLISGGSISVNKLSRRRGVGSGTAAAGSVPVATGSTVTWGTLPSISGNLPVSRLQSVNEADETVLRIDNTSNKTWGKIGAGYISSPGAQSGRFLQANNGGAIWTTLRTEDDGTLVRGLSELSEVNISNVRDAQILTFRNGEWVNRLTLDSTNIPGIPAERLVSGFVPLARIPGSIAVPLTGYVTRSGTIESRLQDLEDPVDISRLSRTLQLALANISTRPTIEERLDALEGADAGDTTVTIDSLADIGDVSSSTPVNNALLVRSGSTWVYRTQLQVAQVPDLPASKITSGTFAAARIPRLTVNHIPNLDASKISSGTFSTSRIPGLDVSIIRSGRFSTTRLPTLWEFALSGYQRSEGTIETRLDALESSGGSSQGVPFRVVRSRGRPTTFMPGVMYINTDIPTIIGGISGIVIPPSIGTGVGIMFYNQVFNALSATGNAILISIYINGSLAGYILEERRNRFAERLVGAISRGKLTVGGTAFSVVRNNNAPSIFVDGRFHIGRAEPTFSAAASSNDRIMFFREDLPAGDGTFIMYFDGTRSSPGGTGIGSLFVVRQNIIDFTNSLFGIINNGRLGYRP